MPKEKPSLRHSLEAMDRNALIALVEDLAGRYPEVKRDLLLDATPARGRIAALRNEIEIAMSQGRGYDSWRGTGSLPELAHVERQLRALLAEGHADEVLTLCELIWELAPGPLNECLDEGETAMTIAECLAVAIEALPKSSLRPAEQIYWELERLLEDDYAVMESAPALADFAEYGREDWREVAELLRARLSAAPKPKEDNAALHYGRIHLLNAAVEALIKADLDDQVIPLLESEADRCRCYQSLVDALLEDGRTEEAQRWCRHGYAQTAGKWPGIAQDLQDRLQEMASRDGRGDVAAAYRAKAFFDDPSVEAYRELKSATEAASCWPAVREQVLSYLDTGVRPDRSPQGNSGAWPLPALDLERPAAGKTSRSKDFPDLVTLIDIAILERRFDDVVELHARQSASRLFSRIRDREVAVAVAPTHPDVALTIWRRTVESLIAQVSPKAYQQAMPYVEQMRKLYKRNGRQDEWRDWLITLRRTHKAKRRLIALLAEL